MQPRGRGGGAPNTFHKKRSYSVLLTPPRNNTRTMTVLHAYMHALLPPNPFPSDTQRSATEVNQSVSQSHREGLPPLPVASSKGPHPSFHSGACLQLYHDKRSAVLIIRTAVFMSLGLPLSANARTMDTGENRRFRYQ